MRVKHLGLLIALGVPVAARAQATDTLSLTGRSSINIGIGLTGQRTANVGLSGVGTHTTGEVGSFGFVHWIHPEVAVTITAAALGTDANVVGGESHSAAVTPILFGASYSPLALAITPTIRPYVSVAAGPYFHTIADAGGLSGETTTVESVGGVRSAVGANWFVSRHFLISVEGDYHAVGHFSHEDVLTQKPSGFGMSFGFGFAWGGR